MSKNNNHIQLENLTKIYEVGESQVIALNGVSCTIKEGDLLAIMGPSGSGKSTLMNIIGCLDRPTKGNYFLEGELVSTLDKNKLARIRNKKIGFVFQTFNLLSRTTALENTELPLLYSKTPGKVAKDLAYQALSVVGLKGRELHRTNQLSGGEQQRVAIARSLVNNPSLLLADEPTGNLDSKTGKEIMQIFKRLNKEKNITIILVTHDPEIARFARWRIYLRDGEIVKEERE
jgi:putative ABC transport system ATP-binding protein